METPKHPCSSSVLVLLHHLTSVVALWFAAHHRFRALLCRCCGTGIGVGGLRLVGGQILHAETPQFVWQDPLTLENGTLGWVITFKLVLPELWAQDSMWIPNNVAVSRSWKHRVNKTTKMSRVCITFVAAMTAAVAATLSPFLPKCTSVSQILSFVWPIYSSTSWNGHKTKRKSVISLVELAESLHKRLVSLI